MDKDVQVRQKEDAKYKKRTACLLLCLSYGCECPGWVRDPDFLKENEVAFGRVYSELPTLNDVFLEITGKELRDKN